MAKFAPDAYFDASLDYVASSTILHVCNAQPTTYGDLSTMSLASVVVGGGDFTKAAGDVSGRKVTVAAQNGVTIGTSGTATHVALASTGDTTLRYVTTCTSQAITAGNLLNVPAWRVEIAAAS